MHEIDNTLLRIISFIVRPIYALANFIHLYNWGGAPCGTSQPTMDLSAILTKDNSSNTIALKQWVHFAQLIDGGGWYLPQTFRPFDYGASENKKRYGQDVPPEWKLDDWTTPTNLICGSKDDLSSDVQRSYLLKQFPKHLGVKMDVFEGWDHNTAVRGSENTRL